MKNSVILIIITHLVIGLGCRKSLDTPAPPEPYVANEITATINEKEWRNCGAINYPNLNAQYIEGECFSMSGVAFCIDGSELFIKVYSIQDIGTYVLGGNSKNVGLYNGKHEYITDPSHQGMITFTKFDKENRKVSGVFSFVATERDSSSSLEIHIKDGSFKNLSYSY